MNATTTTTARRTRSLLAAAAALVLLPGLLASCSAAAPDSGSTKSSGTAAKGATLAECMRGKGYDMPDPSSGGTTLQLSAPDGVDEDQYQADLKSCLDDSAGAGEASMAKQMPGTADRQRKAAECIRDRGFEDYPDDEEAKAGYQPDDQTAFDDVARTCYDEAFAGIGGEATDAGDGAAS
ncbi:hypothetical protein [Curtobacterium sp. MCSS17_006]|uniref:hypothetical protein n=1 Tax=Curtobacterium sp. MCSS17_006 TaxID=2175642 RepID=UPI0015E8B4F0|nr:hypothetical protein [Curtobacterium sp. MCSS17_006]